MNLKSDNVATGNHIPWMQSFFREKLVPVALRGLERMFLPEQHVFCNTFRKCGTDVKALGVSDRYTAMVLIGLTAGNRPGQTVKIDLDRAWGRIASCTVRADNLGHAGLVLWALAANGDARAQELADAIMACTSGNLSGCFKPGSMSLAWLLTGISQAMGHGIDGAKMRASARRFCQLILELRNEETGLFAFGGSTSRKRVLAARVSKHLGSFASQVYPILALSKYASVSGCEVALSAAMKCADRLCELQGPQGQWWWIYHVRTGLPAVRYPVYSVHQDAMGPMALLALQQVAGRNEIYELAIKNSLNWLVEHPECPKDQLIDEAGGIIWRAIQRDFPSRTGRFGLGASERVRMNLAAWLAVQDNRSLEASYLCQECRPYHLGWILLAETLLAEQQDAKT